VPAGAPEAAGPDRENVVPTRRDKCPENLDSPL
jgi:hypothetical protein